MSGLFDLVDKLRDSQKEIKSLREEVERLQSIIYEVSEQKPLAFCYRDSMSGTCSDIYLTDEAPEGETNLYAKPIPSIQATQVAAEAYQVIGALSSDLPHSKEVIRALDYFSAISCGENPSGEMLPFLCDWGQEPIEKAHMAGQSDAGVDPSYSNAKEYAISVSQQQSGNWYSADDIDGLVRRLDVALNGEHAAKQAMLCDIVSQVESNQSSAFVVPDIERELHYMYWSAYRAGHNDTVESCYTDISPCDRFDSWADEVSDCLNGGDMPITRLALSAAPTNEKSSTTPSPSSPAVAVPELNGSDDNILIPRGLIGAACSAIDKKRDAGNLLDELRRYTTGDLSKSPRITEHTDDIAVDKFAAIMKEKLASARDKGRSGWDEPDQCSVEFLAELLGGNIMKNNEGNFVDIANFCMMLTLRKAHPDSLRLYAINSWKEMINRQADD